MATTASAPKVAKYRGEIWVTTGMVLSRPQGGVPVTGKVVKISDPDDPQIATLRERVEAVLHVFEIESGRPVMTTHGKLHNFVSVLRAMKDGKYDPFPPVTKSCATPLPVKPRDGE